MIMIALSLLANVAITFSVTFAIWRGSSDMAVVFGPDTPARRILACVYLTIGLISLGALIGLAVTSLNGYVNVYAILPVIWVLLPLQIIYKLMTAVALGLRHPVVLANLGVVVLHIITLATLL